MPRVKRGTKRRQRRKKILEDAASIVETMLPAMEPHLNVCQTVTNLTECFSYTPALLRDFCECLDILLGRSSTRLQAIYDLENIHLVILVNHVRERTGGFHWDTLAELVHLLSPAGQTTLTADILRLRFNRASTWIMHAVSEPRTS